MKIIVGALFATGLTLCVSIRNTSIQHVTNRVFAAIHSATHTATPTQTITTEVGERKTLQLINGTEIEVNTSSIVHVDLDSTSRNVVLERGEIILNAMNDSHAPWLLRCDDLEIELTSAKVHLRYDAMESSSRINVIAGSASIKRAAEIENLIPGHPRFHPLLVHAGEFVMIRASLGIPSRFNPAEIDRRLAWTQGMVMFQGESLRDAVAEFNRYNKRQLVIGDDSIAALVPGGRFHITDVDEFASSLHKVFRVRAIPMHATGAGPGVIMLVGPSYRDI